MHTLNNPPTMLDLQENQTEALVLQTNAVARESPQLP